MEVDATMSNKYHSVTVAIEKGLKEEDIKHIIDAIKMIKGVISAEGNIADATLYIAESRARHEMQQKIVDIIFK